MRGGPKLALLALLVAAGCAAATGAPCMAEEQCLASHCSSGYGVPARDADWDSWPYEVSWRITTWPAESYATQIEIRVCSLECQASDRWCQPVKSARVRMADDTMAVLAAANDNSEVPWYASSVLSPDCGGDGPGWFFGDDLYWLSDDDMEPDCGYISALMPGAEGGSRPSTLADLCQQNVKLVAQNGTTVFDMAEVGVGCLFTLQLADGTTIYDMLVEDDAAWWLLPPTVPVPAPAPAPGGYGGYGGGDDGVVDWIETGGSTRNLLAASAAARRGTPRIVASGRAHRRLAAAGPGRRRHLAASRPSPRRLFG